MNDKNMKTQIELSLTSEVIEDHIRQPFFYVPGSFRFYLLQFRINLFNSV